MGKYIYTIFNLSFILIQPSKILADISGTDWFLSLFFLPVPFYLHLIYKNRTIVLLKTHSQILILQIFLLILHYFFLNLYWNKYSFFFIFTPHYFIMAKEILKQSKDNFLFTKSIAFYTTIILALSLISIISYDSNISLIDYLKNYFTTTFSRNTTIDRWRLLEGMNFGFVLFHSKPLTLEAVALTVYPLVLFSILFQQRSLLKSKVVQVGLISSLILILLKNSRGEIIFLIILFSYPLAKRILQKARFLVLLIFPVGFLQLFLGSKILNGRGPLNNFFIESINIFGNGIGYASDRINILTKGDYSSFHNIHFELITNFGIIVYFIVISLTGYYLLKHRYNKTKHIIVCLYFFLMTTNFELFDVYFSVPLAMAFAKENPEL